MQVAEMLERVGYGCSPYILGGEQNLQTKGMGCFGPTDAPPPFTKIDVHTTLLQNPQCPAVAVVAQWNVTAWFGKHKNSDVTAKHNPKRAHSPSIRSELALVGDSNSRDRGTTELHVGRHSAQAGHEFITHRLAAPASQHNHHIMAGVLLVCLQVLLEKHTHAAHRPA
jgi:hypothetical protein